MQTHPHRLRALALATGLALLVFSGGASADPPSRVARLGYTSGTVSFSPAGENDWLQATVNRPLTNGDRLWTDDAARAEIQVGGANLRMSANTSVSVLNLDDRIVQLQVTQGVLNLRVRRLAPNQVFEVDTPNLAFTVRQSGDYRIVVDPNQNATDVIVRSGRAQVHGEGAAYTIDPSQPYRFYGTGLRDYQVLGRPVPDTFDRWASDRDRRYDSSPSIRYLSPDVVGYQDLDANGTWRRDRTYGNVWVPNRVAAGWTPYRDGHWSWIDPWGWTWVDDAPWGYAVSHYGRWTNMAGTWGWVPGPARTPAVYAPALVAFIGGSNFKVSISSGNVGGVGWFPLAPREVYQPAYQVSRGYIDSVNRSNTVVNNTVINNKVVNNTVVNNTYNTTNVTQVVYANRQVPGAVVVVPATAFAQSQPVARAAVQVTAQSVASAPVAVVAAVAPTAVSVRGAAAVGEKPPGRVFERPVVALAAPPAARAGFVAQQQQLADRPGKPLEDVARKALVAVSATPAPVVKVVVPVAVAAGAVLPAPAASVARPGVASARAEGQMAAATGPASAPVAAVAAPAASAPASVQRQAIARPAASAPLPAQAGRPAVQSAQPGAAAAGGQPVASAPRPATPVAAPAAKSSQAASPVPAAPEQPQRAAIAKPAASSPVAAPAPTGQPAAPARTPATPAASGPRTEAAPAPRPAAEARPPAAAATPVPVTPAAPPPAATTRANTPQPAPDPVPARQAPPQRAVPPPVAAPAPQPMVPPSPPAAPPAAVARPTPLPAPAARPEPASAPRASESRGPANAAPRQPPAPPEDGSRAEPRGQRAPRAAASAPGEPRNQGEERRREEDNRKPKG